MTDNNPGDAAEEKTPADKRAGKSGQRPPFLALLMLILLGTSSGGFMMVFAGVFWALAVVILTGNLKARRKGTQVQGEIIGIKVRRGKTDRHIHYHPVYKYTLPSTGVTYETTSTLMHNLPTGLETGTHIPLMVQPERPLIARPFQLRFLLLWMVILLVPGTWLFLLAAREMSPGMLALALGIIVAWTAIHMMPYLLGEDKTGKLAADEAQEVAELNALPLKNISDVMASKSGQRQLAGFKGSGIAFLVVAALLLACSGWLARDLVLLEMHGARAEGTVTDVDCQTKRSGSVSNRRSSTKCYATFAFKDIAGAAQSFKPSSTSSLDNYEKGQKVTILYLPADPVGSAMIDKGAANIQWPLFLFLISAICFYRAGRNLCASRYNERKAA